MTMQRLAHASSVPSTSLVSKRPGLWNSVRRAVLPVFGPTKASAPELTTCSRRSMAGSLRASIQRRQGTARRAGLRHFFAGGARGRRAPCLSGRGVSAQRLSASSPVGLKRPMLPINCSKAFISEPEVGVSRSTKLTSCASSSPCRSTLVTVPSSSNVMLTTS
jgi:hypothetical protein